MSVESSRQENAKFLVHLTFRESGSLSNTQLLRLKAKWGCFRNHLTIGLLIYAQHAGNPNTEILTEDQLDAYEYTREAGMACLEESNLVVFADSLKAGQVFGKLDHKPCDEDCHLDHVTKHDVSLARRQQQRHDVHLLSTIDTGTSHF